MYYQHHIQLRTPEQISYEDALKWYHTVKEFGPENVVYSYDHNGKDIAMEYGTYDDEEMPHGYVVPLTRDITSDEAMFIIAAWEYLFPGDFNIELSNQFDVMGDEGGDVEWDIAEDLKEQVINDLNKWNHNRWVDRKISEGWRWSNYYSTSNKTHPALRNWDTLPESHRRTREISNREIFEWLKSSNILK
jgi:hypothetical protein